MLMQELAPHDDQCEEAMAMRLMVLEMLVALIAARLPQRDLEEVVGMLVFVANASQETSEHDVMADSTRLAQAQRYATEMLDRMSKVRKNRRVAGSAN
jgi:hypothetical protein